MSINRSLSGSNIINHQSLGQTLFKLNRQKYEKRRRCAPGFPFKGKLKTIRDVERYFTGDKIQCLLCGRWFKSVGRHMTGIHNTTPDEYKLQFGLPLDRGLTSAELHGNLSDIQKRLYSDGLNPLSNAHQRRKGTAKARSLSHRRRPPQPFNRERMRDTHKHSSKYGLRTTDEDVARVDAEVAKTGQTITQVCLQDSMPCRTAYYSAKHRIRKRGKSDE